MATYYWVLGDGTWDNSNVLNWSLLSGGVPGAGPPLAGGDTVIFDDNSGAGTCTTAATAGMFNMTFNSEVTTLVLGANLTMDQVFTYTKGTITLASFTLQCQIFFSNSTSIRVLNFGTGKIQCTGNNGNTVNLPNLTNFSFTGTSNITLSYAGATGTRTCLLATGATEANSLNFNITGGTDNVHIVLARNINFTGFSGIFLDSAAHTIYGNLTLSATMTVASGGNGSYFSGTSGTQTILSNGVTINTPLEFDGAGGTRTLADALTLLSTRALTLTRGTFNAAGFAVSVGLFASSNANARTLAMGAGAWTITGAGATAWNTATVTNLTVTGTPVISMTSASAKAFAGGGKTWGTLNQGGAGTLTLTGANTFADLTDTTNGTTIILPASVTTTVAAFSLGGSSSSVTVLQSSSAATAATISKASGQVDVSWLSIKDSAATGGATWRAPVNRGNVNVSGNSGWVFNPVGGAGRAGIGLGLGLTL